MNLKLISVTVFSGVIAASAIVPAAFAEDGNGTSGQSDTPSTAVSSLPASRVRMEAGGYRVRLATGMPGRPDVDGWHGPRGERGPRFDGIFEAVAGQLGVSTDELRSLLADGSTPLDLAAARGIDASQFIASVTAEVRASVEQAVADGTISQAVADRVLTDLDGHVAAMLSSTPPSHEPREGHGRKAGGVFEAAAGVLGMTVDDLRARVGEGTSILDVAVAQGIDGPQFTADVAAAARGEIEQAVADGTISQDMADRVLADLDEHVANALSSTGPRGEHGPRGACDEQPGTGTATTTEAA